MDALKQIYRRGIAFAHRIGINRNPLARKAVDAVKRFSYEHSLPFALPMQGFMIRGLGISDYARRTYESETTLLFRRILKPGMVVVDVGAQLGYFTLLFSKLVGRTGKVYAFEPFLPMFAKLKKNVARNRWSTNCTLVSRGASDRETSQTYYIPSASVYPVKNENSFADNENLMTTIQSGRLDAYFKDRMSPIDMVKIDIEGAELLALKGMEGIMQANPSLKIVIEIAPKVHEKIGQKTEDLLTLIQSYGFVLERILPDGRTAVSSASEVLAMARANRFINIYCHR